MPTKELKPKVKRVPKKEPKTKRVTTPIKKNDKVVEQTEKVAYVSNSNTKNALSEEELIRNKRIELDKTLKNLKAEVIQRANGAIPESLIDTLLQVKGEIDTQPTYVYVPIKGIVGEIKGDGYRITQTTGEIIFHTNHVDFIYRPTLSVYHSFASLIELADKEDMTKEELEQYEYFLQFFQNMPLMHINFLASNEIRENAFISELDVWNRYLKEVENQLPAEDDSVANNEYMEQLQAIEKL